jgi:UDP-glucose 4-epimerase
MKSFTVFGTDYGTRDGSCIRDYVHVCDIANAHVIALAHLQHTSKSCDVFNLGTGNGVSVLEAISAFKRVTGLTPNYVIGKRRPGDVEAIYSDCSKVESELHWKANFSLDEMMASAWKWEEEMVHL